MKYIDANTIQLDAEYTEPSTSVDGTPLTDLAYTTLYYQLGTSPSQRLPQLLPTKPSGGGTIQTPVLVPVSTGQKVDVTLWVTATDTGGNESAKSNTQVIVVDRIPPSAPTGFSAA